MKVVFGSYSQTESIHESVSGSGYENIAYVLDGVWRNLDAEVNNHYDVVLACLALPSTVDRKKPSSWKKLIGIQESGFGVINTDWWINYVSTMGFDGFLVHTDELVDFYKVFGKPVWKFNPAYCFETARKQTIVVEKEENRVCVNLTRHAQPESNVTGTIRVMQRLPDYQFHSYTDQVDLLSSLKERLGVNNWTIHKQVSWLSYLREAAKCPIHLSMDNRMTWGRFQLDAMSCGSVCVGCHSEVQSQVYPFALVSQTDIDKAVSLIKEYSSKNYQVDDSLLRKFSHDQLRSRIMEVSSEIS
jgi:hypothetical protein